MAEISEIDQKIGKLFSDVTKEKLWNEMDLSHANFAPIIEEFKAKMKAVNIGEDVVLDHLIADTLGQIAQYKLNTQRLEQKLKGQKEQPSKINFAMRPFQCRSCQFTINEFKFNEIKIFDYKNKRWWDAYLTRCTNCQATFAITKVKKIVKEKNNEK